jgi:TonB family protein
MRPGLLGLSLLAAFGAAGFAEGDRPADWVAKPTAEMMADYYPDEAVDKSVSGTAVVVCTTNPDTRLTGCTVDEEFPIGMGFGGATVRMAEAEFRIRPATVNGKPEAGGTARIPVRWITGMPGSRGVIFKAIWAEAPTFADVEAAWPESAGDLPEGRGVIRCRVSSDGRLSKCGVAGQTPKGSPFGGAARTLADKFRVKLTPEQAREYTVADVAISVRFFNPATPQGKARRIVGPQWIRQIDPAKIVALFPAAAADKGVASGVGVADCLVAPDGALTDCKVARESPEGLGFGEAAVAVAGITQMNPWSPDGRPSHGVRVKLPINFSLAAEAAPPAAD